MQKRISKAEPLTTSPVIGQNRVKGVERPLNNFIIIDKKPAYNNF
jgi:hypothetical protein